MTTKEMMQIVLTYDGDFFGYLSDRPRIVEGLSEEAARLRDEADALDEAVVRVRNRKG